MRHVNIWRVSESTEKISVTLSYYFERYLMGSTAIWLTGAYLKHCFHLEMKQFPFEVVKRGMEDERRSWLSYLCS
jgi:hypothetical protein